MTRLALALALLAAPAGAETLRPFHPGNSPCKGDCPLEWAAREAGLPMGDPRPLIVPPGSVATWMSYASGGEPHVGRGGLVVMEPQPAQGYRLPDGSWMVRFQECENWSVVRLAQPGEGPTDAPAPMASPPPPWSIAGVGGWSRAPGAPCCGGGVVEREPPTEPRPPLPETPVAVIPLPPTLALALMLGALMMLWRHRA